MLDFGKSNVKIHFRINFKKIKIEAIDKLPVSRLIEKFIQAKI